MFNGDPRYHWVCGKVKHDRYVLRPEDLRWIQFVKFCKKQEWGHPYNLKKGAKYKKHWNDNPRAWHKVR